MKDYSKFTYEELEREEDRLDERYNEISDECAKEGLKWDAFQEKAHDVREASYFVSKYKRLKQTPTVEYGKEWNGQIYTLEEFIKMCEVGGFIDYDGFGNYATESAKSDIEVIPSDIKEKIYRTDFTHVIWFNR